MASEFLVDGDLFVEVVDNNDGGGIPPKRLETLSRAHRDGTFDSTAFPFERSNGYNGVRQLYSRKGPQENIFRSGWGSSLNFEFVYDVSGATMTPRWLDGKNGSPPTPSRLTRLTDNSVRLETFVPEPHRVDVRPPLRSSHPITLIGKRGLWCDPTVSKEIGWDCSGQATFTLPKIKRPIFVVIAKKTLRWNGLNHWKKAHPIRVCLPAKQTRCSQLNPIPTVDCFTTSAQPAMLPRYSTDAGVT